MSAVFPRLACKAPPTSDVPDLSLSPQQQQGGWAVREEHIDEISGMVLARVPGGAFHTGSDEFSSLPREQPVHVVSLSEFWRAECKVTPRQWALVMGEESAPLDDQEHPVTGVSWYEAAPFAEELSTPTGLPYRLPTEAEWEYAAREGGRACTWSGISDIWELASYALYRANRGGRSHPVRQEHHPSPHDRRTYTAQALVTRASRLPNSAVKPLTFDMRIEGARGGSRVPFH